MGACQNRNHRGPDLEADCDCQESPDVLRAFRPPVRDGSWLELTDRLARLRDSMFWRRDNLGKVYPWDKTEPDWEALAAECWQALELARKLRKQAARDAKAVKALLQLAATVKGGRP